MSKKSVIWLIIGACLILIGCIIFGGVMTMLKWDFTKLSTVKYETNEYKIFGDYENISIVTDTADIEIIPADTDSARVVCFEQKNINHTVKVENGTLSVTISDTRKWYEHITIFNFNKSSLKIYIPQGEYAKLCSKSDTGNIKIPKDFSFESADIVTSTGNVSSYASVSGTCKIKTSTGDISVNKITAGALDLSVTTGKISAGSVSCAGDLNVKVSTGNTYLTDVTCKDLISSGSTGNITLNNVIAKERFSIERSTGDVKFEGCDAAEIFIITDTGDVRGSLLSDKIFLAHSDTGRVKVPQSTTGGKCEISCDTGDIIISVNE